ncbi:MAG: A/G-specific adenine glycosylase, partial [Proteobacteria bacterium]|nr:A/G-specific adenine glycosylase [Burkholderiales bacterium]
MIDWQRANGRHDLPWQRTRDPYRIWLSEIMLQQTQVATVIPYYLRFVERFASIAQLAQAPVDDVLTSWSGLGYYSRARNLQRAAVQLMECHGGAFPEAFDDVLALPGIGRSTAAAICAFAFGQRHAILDGNVKRVLARHAGIDGWAGTGSVERALWHAAEARLPERDIETYTQALMDLGAGLCTRTRPRCVACPVAADCVAYRDGRVDAIPGARPRKPMPHRAATVWVLLDGDGRVWLERRPPSGIWGGLWSLPQSFDAASEAHLRATRGAIHHLPPIEHAFTHFRLTIEPLLIDLAVPETRAATPDASYRGADVERALAGVSLVCVAEPGRQWLALDRLETIALPAPVRTLLESIHI